MGEQAGALLTAGHQGVPQDVVLEAGVEQPVDLTLVPLPPGPDVDRGGTFLARDVDVRPQCRLGGQDEVR